VHHRAREAHFALDPRTEPAFGHRGELCGGTREFSAVVDEVVATHDGEWRQARVATSAQSFDEKSDHAARRTRMLEILAHVGVADIERAIRREAIAFFGDREGYDMRAGRGKPLQHSL